MKATPSSLLIDRQPWLAARDAVAVTERPDGSFDVDVRIDGKDPARAEAEAAASVYRAMIRSALHKAVHAQGQVERAQRRMDDL